MKKNLILPAALAAFAAGAGLFTAASSGAQEARENRPQAQSRNFRFEFKNDGSGPRSFRDNQEIQAGAADELDGIPESFRRFFERGRDGGAANPLEDMLKQFEDSGRGAQPRQERGEQSPVPPRGLDPQKLMEELLRRMRNGADGEAQGRLGFGPVRPDGGPSRYSKQHLSVLSEWRPLVKDVRESTVRVLKDGAQAALATIVSADGYALTKASEVDKGKIECEFHDGRIVTAKVVDQLGAYDLALLKLDATGLKPVKFADTEAPVGTLVAAVNTMEDPTAVGVVSVPPRSLDAKSKGFLGVEMRMDQDVKKGVLVGGVIEGGAAKKAGVQPGDIILSINGESIDFPDRLQKRVAALKPDEKVTLIVQRGDTQKTFDFTLGNRSQVPADSVLDRRILDPTAQMGSSLSRNASGYPQAQQTDLALQAEDVGGPVISPDGSVIGLNIARAERVSTFMIPGKVMNSLLTDVQSGRFTLARDFATLQSEIQKHEAVMKEAQETMKAAEAKLQETMQAMERLQKK